MGAEGHPKLPSLPPFLELESSSQLGGPNQNHKPMEASRTQGHVTESSSLDRTAALPGLALLAVALGGGPVSCPSLTTRHAQLPLPLSWDQSTPVPEVEADFCSSLYQRDTGTQRRPVPHPRGCQAARARARQNSGPQQPRWTYRKPSLTAQL